MISVKITDDSLTVVGHAAYAKIGDDIVCASVSAIVQTAVLGLRAIAQCYPDFLRVEVDDQRTRSHPTPPSGRRPEAEGSEPEPGK